MSGELIRCEPVPSGGRRLQKLLRIHIQLSVLTHLHLKRGRRRMARRCLYYVYAVGERAFYQDGWRRVGESRPDLICLAVDDKGRPPMGDVCQSRRPKRRPPFY